MKGVYDMNKTLKRYKRRFKRYMYETFELKVYGILWLLIGLLSLPVLEDRTVLVFTMFWGIPLLFMRGLD